LQQHEQAKAAFEKIISLGRTAAIRKAAKDYWTACNTDEGASEEAGKNLELAIRAIPLDYRQPTVKPLEELGHCMENSDDTSSCYFTLVIALADRIVKLS
jgi:hypothetical protein